MLQLHRKCIPFTPLDKALDKCTVALVTAAGVHGKTQEAFNIADDLGDLTFRVMPGDSATADLMVTHHHYDHTDADTDINVVFPLDALRELQQEGFISEIARAHVGYMGYTMRLKQMYDDAAPAIAEAVDKQTRADLVVLTGG